MNAIPTALSQTLSPATVTLCVAFAQEARRIAVGARDAGDCMIWLLAQLTSDHPNVDMPLAAARMTGALRSKNGPMLWEHGRWDRAAQAHVQDLDA